MLGGPAFTQEYIVGIYGRWNALGSPNVPDEFSHEYILDFYRRGAGVELGHPRSPEIVGGRHTGAETRWWVLRADPPLGLEFMPIKDALEELKAMQAEALRWLFEEEQLLCYYGARDDWHPASYALRAEAEAALAQNGGSGTEQRETPDESPTSKRRRPPLTKLSAEKCRNAENAAVKGKPSEAPLEKPTLEEITLVMHKVHLAHGSKAGKGQAYLHLEEHLGLSQFDTLAVLGNLGYKLKSKRGNRRSPSDLRRDGRKRKSQPCLFCDPERAPPPE